ncbi:MAG: hypothetical protein CW691_06040 [Candidatus Bathyarchaeum sp.]|nr:MAG: hypothetical protein CW691_06040 [Candidatus Bathyarchaeum sp.]
MTQKRGSLGSTRLWILILSIALVVLNIIVFYVYQQSHITEDFYTQLWEYFKSDAFNYVTISLMLPIVSLFLENLFEIRKVVEEKIEKEKEVGLEARWKCIEKTVTVWNDLFSAITDLLYFKKELGKKTKEKDNDDEDEKATIEDIQKKIDVSMMLITELVNSWYFRFPNLRNNVQGSNFEGYVVYFINTLAYSAETVAYHIQKSSKPSEVVELQKTLLTILYGVRSFVYHPLLLILKSSISLWEGEKEKDDAKIANANKIIQTNLDALRDNAEWLRKQELENNEIFLAITGKKGNNIRKASKAVEALGKTKSEEEILVSADYLKFKELFNKIKHEEIMHAKLHSLKWIRYLSDQLQLRFSCFYVLDRAKWVREQNKNSEQPQQNSNRSLQTS